MASTTTPLPRGRRDDEFTSERRVYEPHKIGLPPLGAYVRELWRRRDFAREMAKTSLQSQHFNTAFGQLWLVLNPLLLAGVYFILVDILRGGASQPGFFAHAMARSVSSCGAQSTCDSALSSDRSMLWKTKPSRIAGTRRLRTVKLLYHSARWSSSPKLPCRALSRSRV